MPSTEEGSQSDSESDVKTTNECDEHENESDPYHAKWGKDFQKDIGTCQRNGIKHNNAFAHQY